MAAGRPLVTARWEDITLLAWDTPAAAVRARVPPGVELDLWEGRPLVNVVALRFLGPRVAGRRLPGLDGFAQLNLRTFVRRGAERGVTFLRELVPSRLVVLAARVLFRQPYGRHALEATVASAGDERTVEYRAGAQAPGRLRVTGRGAAAPTDALTRFVLERYCAYGRGPRGALWRFAVAHPPWATRTIRRLDVDLPWGALFGAEWAWLADRPPIAAVLAVGSEVGVHAPRAVR
jgi:uncharacterized protein YqjF (DUF2071 family)